MPQRKPNHIYFLIVILALTFAVGVAVGCGSGQAETRRAEAREILKTLEYLDRTKDYLPNLLKLTDTFYRVAELEGKGTMDAEIELLKSEIDVIRLQRSRFQTTDAPLQAVTYRDLVLQSFDSMERSFTMLLATFQEVIQPAPSQRQLAERFWESSVAASKSIRDAVSDAGKASHEYGRLLDQLEERVRVLGATKRTITAPVTESDVQEYLKTTSKILGSIADAHDEWRRLSAERTRTIFSLPQHLDPSKVRSSIEAEGQALDRLYSLVSEAVVSFTQMNPRIRCQKLHRLMIEGLKLEEQAFKEFKLWWKSADQANWERGTQLLIEADQVKGQINPQVAKCIDID